MLIPALLKVQSVYGWVPPQVQKIISKALWVPLADIHGVIEFYSMLYNQPTAKKVIRLCEGSACKLAGSKSIMEAVESKLSLGPGETSQDGKTTYENVHCLGLCEFSPSGLHQEEAAGKLTIDELGKFLEGKKRMPKLKVYGKPLTMLSRIGKIDPESLKDYEEHGGYQGLRKALDMQPSDLIELVEASGILGRGGAQFPVGQKWRFTRAASGDPRNKHIIVNADESEPGTFKDRYLLEEDPFSIIEGLTLAGYAVGAENGWIFVRGEYVKSFNRLENAVQVLEEAGYLGKDIFGKPGFNFNIELRMGAGAYICGEETALFEAIEGKRGFPRSKPPFPTTHGLFNQPTAINNVETVSAVLSAINLGVEEWRKLGTEQSSGTKLFCISGHVEKPGLYEMPFGITIKELIDMAGGVPNQKDIKAALMGGAAGVFIGPDKLDTPLTYEATQTQGIPLGSGVIMVFDEDADIHQALYGLSQFFAHESCGKCFPCQLGTQRQKEILARIVHQGKSIPGDRHDLSDIGFTMTETSLCGLGQTAASAIISAIELWPELVK